MGGKLPLGAGQHPSLSCFEASNVFVSKSTLWSIQLPEFLVAGAPGKTRISTASHMVNWLWKQSQEEKIGIRYTIIFHKLIEEYKFHKHQKGLPPKDIISL
jgi:hypothetical protein